MHVDVVVRLPQRLVQFRLELEREGVELLRPVQGDAGAPVLHLVFDAVETAHAFPSPDVG